MRDLKPHLATHSYSNSWNDCLDSYTECAGWAVTAAIPGKFGIAHCRSRPEVGGTKCIDMYRSGAVSWPSHIFGTSDKNMMTPIVFLGPKQNFYELK